MIINFYFSFKSIVLSLPVIKIFNEYKKAFENTLLFFICKVALLVFSVSTY